MNNNNIVLFDSWHNQFLSGESTNDIMEDIVSQLNNIRINNTSISWKEFT